MQEPQADAAERPPAASEPDEETTQPTSEATPAVKATPPPVQAAPKPIKQAPKVTEGTTKTPKVTNACQQKLVGNVPKRTRKRKQTDGVEESEEIKRAKKRDAGDLARHKKMLRATSPYQRADAAQRLQMEHDLKERRKQIRLKQGLWHELQKPAQPTTTTAFTPTNGQEQATSPLPSTDSAAAPATALANGIIDPEPNSFLSVDNVQPSVESDADVSDAESIMPVKQSRSARGSISPRPRVSKTPARPNGIRKFKSSARRSAAPRNTIAILQAALESQQAAAAAAAAVTTSLPPSGTTAPHCTLEPTSPRASTSPEDNDHVPDQPVAAPTSAQLCTASVPTKLPVFAAAPAPAPAAAPATVKPTQTPNIEPSSDPADTHSAPASGPTPAPAPAGVSSSSPANSTALNALVSLFRSTLHPGDEALITDSHVKLFTSRHCLADRIRHYLLPGQVIVVTSEQANLFVEGGRALGEILARLQ